MKDKKQGDLIFLDEYRSQGEQEQMQWSSILPQAAYEVLEISDEEMDDFQYEYLTTSDWRRSRCPKLAGLLGI